MKQLVFIPESGQETGMGHVYRLISMAQMLEPIHSIFFLAGNELALTAIRQNGFEGRLSSFENNELVDRIPKNSSVIFDGYHFTADLFEAFRKKGIRTLYLDDFAKDFPPADIILNTADLEWAPEIPSVFSQYVYGHSYILLRKEFLSLPKRMRDTSQPVKKCFVCLGAIDPSGLTIPLINNILELQSNVEKLLPELQFTVLASSMNPHLPGFKTLSGTTLLIDASAAQIAEIISQHDFAIVSASNIAQECIAIGIPLACIQTADNQQHLYSSLTANKLCYPLGTAATFPRQLEAFLRKLHESDFRQSLLENQRKWIDGKSRERIQSLIASLRLAIRDVTSKDSALLLDWKNDRVSLENSFNSAPVKQQEHEKWFQNELDNDRSAMYLIELDNKPVSLVRFSTRDEKATIGITVGPESRGQRLAARSLVLACIRYFEQFPEQTVEAYIKIDNTASIKAFQSAGFRSIGQTEVNGIPALLLTKTSNLELPKQAGFC